MATKKPENMPFEAALDELKNIVESMEQGNLSLDESLKQFERGIHLVRASQQKLNDAEQRVQLLVNDSSPVEGADISQDLQDFQAPVGD